MQASLALRIAAVTTLVVAAFFAGRISIKAPDPARAEDAPPSRPVEKLTALTQTTPKNGPPKDPFNNSQDSPASDPYAAAVGHDAEVVASILADASSHVGNIEAMSEVLISWLEHDPDAAIAWLNRGERPEATLRSLFRLWGGEESDAATAWLAANQNLKGYDSAALGLALGLVRHRRAENGLALAETALALADTVGSPAHRVRIWMEAGIDLFSADQDELRERLSNTDIPEDMQAFMIGNWRETISNRAKRNAQNLASVYASAIAAGASFEGKTAVEIAAELKAGIFGGDRFSTTTFQVPNMSASEVERALRNLSFESDQGSLSYDPAEQDDL